MGDRAAGKTYTTLVWEGSSWKYLLHISPSDRGCAMFSEFRLTGSWKSAIFVQSPMPFVTTVVSIGVTIV
jgi:hypothetical protein